MSQQNPILVYVTHAWETSDDYLRVFEFLESARNFYYRNCSEPEHRPVDQGVEGLREDYRRQMRPAEVVVALGSLYARNRDALLFQLHFAQGSKKPVVLLSGFGRELALPRDVTDMVNERVGWEQRGLVDAIRRTARHENTGRWDTIEFKLD